MWNSATIYGEEQHNEKLLGEVLREGDNRSMVTLVTKWGLKIVDGQLTSDGAWSLAVDYDRNANLASNTDVFARTTGSPEFAKECIDQSIKNFGTAPDIWLLHRVDSKVPIEESVRAMEEARKAGKCRFIGLSAVSPEGQARE